MRDTSATLRQRLEFARRARDFAMAELGLPDNGSYRSYADLGRPYATWNLFAAPELSVTPKRWCFPVAGCVAYRGYFDEEQATRAAARLAARGYDVQSVPSIAYSTLGHLRDPVLNTMLGYGDASSPPSSSTSSRTSGSTRRATATSARPSRGRRDRGAAALARARGGAGSIEEVPRRARAGRTRSPMRWWSRRGSPRIYAGTPDAAEARGQGRGVCPAARGARCRRPCAAGELNNARLIAAADLSTVASRCSAPNSSGSATTCRLSMRTKGGERRS